MLLLQRRGVVLAALAHLAARPPSSASSASIVETSEASLLDVLAAGTPLTLQQASTVDALIRELERDGGSQSDQVDGIGAFGPWLGCWDIKYLGASGGAALEAPAGMRLVSARAFVNGPPDARRELRGLGDMGGASIELVYAGPQGTQLLLTRSGSLIKLPALGYQLDFASETEAYELSANGARTVGRVGEGPPMLVSAVSKASAALRGDALRGGTLLQVPDGGATRDFSYLSEQLWISRGRKGSRAPTVLQRCDARALAPPPTRPDLTSTCSQTGWQSGAGLCRTQPLF